MKNIAVLGALLVAVLTGQSAMARGGEIFESPTKNGYPVYSRDQTPIQFCREQGYQSGSVLQEVFTGGILMIYDNGRWVTDGRGMVAQRLLCEGRSRDDGRRGRRGEDFYSPQKNGYPIYSRDGTPERFCQEKGFRNAEVVSESFTGGILMMYGNGRWVTNGRGMIADHVICRGRDRDRDFDFDFDF